MFSSLFRRNTASVRHELPTTYPLPNLDEEGDLEHPEETRSRDLLIMAQNHVLAFLVIMYLLYVICKFVFGWTPGTPAPPTKTIHLSDILGT